MSDPVPTSAPRRRTLLKVLFALFGLPVMLDASTWTLLTTPFGETRLLQWALKTVNEAIRGQVHAESLDVSWKGISLSNLAVRDPEGKVVAEVDSLFLSALPSLPNVRHVQVNSLNLKGLRLFFQDDERGFNVLRAFSSRKPSSDKPSSAPPTFEISLHQAHLQDAQIQYQRLRDTTQTLRIDRLQFDAAGRYTSPQQTYQLHSTWVGQLEKPFNTPFSLLLAVEGQGTQLHEGQIKLSANQAQLEAEIHSDEKRTWANLKQFLLPAELGKTLWEDYPLQVALSARGKLSSQEGKTSVTLLANAGKGTVELQGTANLDALRFEDVKLSANHIDLAEWVGGPSSQLSLQLSGAGGGANLKTLEGQLLVDMPPSAVEGQRLGPLRLQASAHKGQILLSELFAQFPGASLIGKGAGTTEAFEFGGQFNAHDVEKLGRALANVTGQKWAPMKGRADLRVLTQGSLSRPSLSLLGNIPYFQRDTVEMKQVSLQAQVPNLRKPMEAQIRLRAESLALGARSFDQVAMDVSTQGRELKALVSAQALGDLVASLQGTLASDGKALRISTLSLRYPEATWTLEKPTQLSFRDHSFVLEPLVLSSLGQRLSAQASQRGEKLQAKLELENLELSKLPGALVDKTLHLGGLVNARVTLSGVSRSPIVEVQLDVAQGKVQKFSNLQVRTQAHWEDDRLTGTLESQSPYAWVTAQVDMPVAGFSKHRAVPLRLDADVRNLQWEKCVSKNITGLGSLRLRVSGQADVPQVQLVAKSEDTLWHEDNGPTVSIPLATLELSSQPQGNLRLQAFVNAFEGNAHADLQTPWTLHDVVEKTWSSEILRNTPLDFLFQLSKMQLASVAATGVTQTNLEGELSARLEAHGPLNTLQSEGEWKLEPFSIGGSTPAWVQGNFRATKEKLSTQVFVNRDHQTVLALDGHFQAPLGAGFDVARRTTTPFQVSVRTPSLTLEQVRKWLVPSAPSNLDGNIHFEASLQGTLADSRLDVRLGLTPAFGGTLAAHVETEFGFSAPAKNNPRDWKKAPLKAQLKAHDFDLRFLSGLHPQVRVLEGVLNANAQAQGVLGAPTLLGKVEWQQGRLGLLGYGEYRNMALKLSGTQDKIDLEELRALAGAGKLQLRGGATRHGRAWQIHTEAQAQQLPIIMDDQLYAMVTTDMAADGLWDEAGLSIRPLTLSKATVELPENSRKDLQELDRPDDIIWIRRGKRMFVKQGTRGSEEETLQNEQVASAKSRVSMHVDAPRNLHVKGSDLNVELGLSPDFRIDVGSSTFIDGEMSVRGRLDVYSRRFDVQKGSMVKFAGPAKSPYLNVLAEHRNEREQVTVFVTVTGRGKNFTLKTTSNPSLPDSEIYTLLMTGRRTLKRGSGASMPGDQAMSIVGAAAASLGKSLLANKLPLDMLSVETGEKGLSQLRVEGGTYLSPSAYLGASVQWGANPERGENTVKGTFEYQFSPQWSFEASYGDANAGGAELLWSREY